MVGNETGSERSRTRAEIKVAVESRARLDLMERASPLLDERARREVRGNIDEVLAHIQDQNDELRSIWADLHSIGAPLAPDVSAVCTEVDELLRSGETTFTGPLQLVQSWLEQVERSAREALGAETRRLKTQSVTLDRETAERVTTALDRRNYAEAVRLVAGGTEQVHADGHRETPWRSQAEERCVDVRSSLAHFPDPLAKRWINGVTGNLSSDRPLSRLFAQYTVGNLRDPERTAPFHQMATCEGISRRLADQQHNPCFFPQLAAFGYFVIAVPNTRVTDRNFARSAAALVAAASKRRDSRVLVLVLAPNLTQEARRRALVEIRSRGQHAAFIDDLDLYRIISPTERGTPDPLLSLLEIAFEQQPLDVVNPFGAHDGQAVRMEMYVGRSDEAAALTSPVTTRYSRLFSGRKLGKSALLRFISESEHTLPSGNRLRVVYVPIVGLETDQSVVSRILESLAQSARWSCPDVQADTPFGRLDHAMKAFSAEHPKESLLFVLDEADVFVESQLRAYETEKERCLSFMMRTMTESTLDDRGTPKVRFLFSGYRATNTREGPWANWGDCLVLKPLEEKDAIDLVAGPLARLGVDVTAHGPSIAHRCGLQPAVLLRFGNVLLSDLAQRRLRGDLTRTLQVSHLDIAKAFSQELVQDEIRAVARNNFQGNRNGFLVFNALLLVFAEDGPNSDILDLEDRIVECLGGSAKPPDSVDWHELCEGFDTPAAFVRRKLDDFVERQLITRTRHVDSLRHSYRLRFPHHLPTLLAWEPQNEVAQLLSSLADGTSDLRAASRAMISEDQLEDIREWCSQPAEIHEAYVVVSSWPDSLGHAGSSIGERLGMPPTSDAAADGQLYVNLNPESADEMLNHRNETAPPPLIIGGPTILRWALKRRPSVERLLEIFGVGRMSNATVRWWFGRVRGLEFEVTDALARVCSVTAGVPYLVQEVDELLLEGGDGGITISRRALGRKLDDFAQRRGSAMQSFAGLAGLSPREREVLRMVCVASGGDAKGGEGIGELLLPELWADFDDDARGLGFDDAASVEFLMLMGFIPRVGSETIDLFDDIASVAASDPIRELCA